MPQQVGSESYMAGDYAAYQAKYRASLKESDKKTIELLGEVLGNASNPKLRLLDIGCHTGNLLYHIRQRFPSLDLKGGDIFPAIIESCRDDPGLQGIRFDTLDILSLNLPEVADLVVVSAVLFRFSDEQHEAAWRGIFNTLATGGAAIIFDWYHPFKQTVRIIDETEAHPEGLILNIRSQHYVSELLQRIGFADIRFFPFNIQIDLKLADASDGVRTYTRTTVDGERLQFRGAIYQPWCHLVVRKG